MHRYVVPLLYTLLWIIGILLCGREISSSNKILSQLEYGDFFVAVFYIYVIFLFECVVGIFDKAIEHSKKQYTVNLLYLLCMILVNVALTLWLCFRYIFENDTCSKYFWYVIICMSILKLISCFFSNNITTFFVKIHINTLNSSLDA